MILFFGTRPGQSETKLLDHVTCPYCGQKNTMTLFKTANYVHLFWIKIFKLNTQRSVVCSHCKRHYDEAEFTPEMVEGIPK